MCVGIIPNWMNVYVCMETLLTVFFIPLSLSMVVIVVVVGFLPSVQFVLAVGEFCCWDVFSLYLNLFKIAFKEKLSDSDENEHRRGIG